MQATLDDGIRGEWIGTAACGALVRGGPAAVLWVRRVGLRPTSHRREEAARGLGGVQAEEGNGLARNGTGRGRTASTTKWRRRLA